MSAIVEGMSKLDQGWAPAPQGGSIIELAGRVSVLADSPSPRYEGMG